MKSIQDCKKFWIYMGENGDSSRPNYLTVLVNIDCVTGIPSYESFPYTHETLGFYMINYLKEFGNLAEWQWRVFIWDMKTSEDMYNWLLSKIIDLED